MFFLVAHEQQALMMYPRTGENGNAMEEGDDDGGNGDEVAEDLPAVARQQRVPQPAPPQQPDQQQVLQQTMQLQAMQIQVALQQHSPADLQHLEVRAFLEFRFRF